MKAQPDEKNELFFLAQIHSGKSSIYESDPSLLIKPRFKRFQRVEKTE